MREAVKSLSKKTFIARVLVGIVGALFGWFQGTVEGFPYKVLPSSQ
jgi:hypothetical protein